MNASRSLLAGIRKEILEQLLALRILTHGLRSARALAAQAYTLVGEFEVLCPQQKLEAPEGRIAKCQLMDVDLLIHLR